MHILITVLPPHDRDCLCPILHQGWVFSASWPVRVGDPAPEFVSKKFLKLNNMNLPAQTCPTLCDPVGTVARQAPLSMGFPRREYWSGLPFLPPWDPPDPGIEPASPALAGRFFTTEPSGRPQPGCCHQDIFFFEESNVFHFYCE